MVSILDYFMSGRPKVLHRIGKFHLKSISCLIGFLFAVFVWLELQGIFHSLPNFLFDLLLDIINTSLTDNDKSFQGPKKSRIFLEF